MTMSTRVRTKICGIKSPDMARVAVSAGADAVGLVFVEASPRYVSIDAADDIARAIGPFTDTVGLFLNENVDVIRRHLDRIALTTVQLHGNVTPEQLDALRPCRVLRAISFKPESAEYDLGTWNDYYQSGGNLSGIIWDTPSTKMAGGTGEAFDWSAAADVLNTIQPSVPIILAGGLDPSNVTQAIRTVCPYGVDVSSGVEATRGVKDASKIEAFCRAVRAAS